ncbi:MAG: DUF5103 domain-containing protein [Muribaculaceae bacterium]|nr:DUF5103 domain-containing protein [Muribaculaceae bacterium]
MTLFRKLTLGLALTAAAAMAPEVGAANTATSLLDPHFRTLTVTLNDQLMADPVLTLGDPGSRIVFSFDEIGDDRSYLRCRLVHCNADWQPSALAEMEYVEGFNQADIEDYGFSSNTFVHYVNYHFSLPDEGLAPLVAGNYLWQVYDADDPDRVLLQARFRVSENTAFVAGSADGRTDRGFNDSLQQLSISLSPGGSDIPNPYADIFVEVTRNMRPDTSRILRAPSRMQGSTIVYEHMPQLIFPAGNEYRRFETVRNNYPGMGVEETFFSDSDNMYHARLATAEPRAGRNYSFDSTQHGRFKIDEYNSTDPDLGADYIMTHFSLDMPEIPGAEIYVEGDLSLRGFSDSNRMKYLPEEGIYTLSIPLKQGSYNYQYVVVDKDARGVPGSPADQSAVEGDHFETLNEYNVYVWMRTPGSRYDRLIASRTIQATP